MHKAYYLKNLEVNDCKYSKKCDSVKVMLACTKFVIS